MDKRLEGGNHGGLARDLTSRCCLTVFLLVTLQQSTNLFLLLSFCSNLVLGITDLEPGPSPREAWFAWFGFALCCDFCRGCCESCSPWPCSAGLRPGRASCYGHPNAHHPCLSCKGVGAKGHSSCPLRSWKRRQAWESSRLCMGRIPLSLQTCPGAQAVTYAPFSPPLPPAFHHRSSQEAH